MSRVHETWDGFWGPLLLVRFHEQDTERWPTRERRADWVIGRLSLNGSSRILDLGCGDGLLDVCLGRRGVRVTGVDRLASVLSAAREHVRDEPVEFVCGDLREVSFDDGAFDAVLLFEVVGLMGPEADAKMLASAAKWLRPGGRVLVDCPSDPKSFTSSSERVFDDGVLRMSSSFDPGSRIQTIEPTFERADGTVIDLVDAYDGSRTGQPGVHRYLYSLAQVAALMEGAGFRVTEVPHYAWNSHFLLMGELERD